MSLLMGALASGCGGCGAGEEPAVDMGTSAQDMASAADMKAAEDLSGDMRADAEPDSRAEADMKPGLTGCVVPDSSEDPTETFAVNGWDVTVYTNSGLWSAKGPGGEVVGAPSCVERADGSLPSVRVGQGRPAVRKGFGAWRVSMKGDKLDWFELTGEIERVQQREGGEVAIEWPVIGDSEATASLVFSGHGARDLRVELESSLPELTAGELHFACDEGESFFGLGTQVTGMDLRPGLYPLWTMEQGIDKPDDGGIFPVQNLPEAAYAPMGVLHSSRGWSALVTHDSYSEIDLCEADPERVIMRSYKKMPGLVFVAGATPRERMTSLTEYTGRITTPARWTFGPWNDTVGGPERVAEVTAKLRALDIPSSAIWVEDWIGGTLTPNGFRLSYAWEWSQETYPTLPQDITGLHERGFAFLAYFNTFVPNTNRMWDEGVAGGYLIEDNGGEPYEFRDPAFRTASLIDLTNPMAREWLGGYLREASDELKIDGWMADFSEWLPEDATLHSGEDAWLVHNRYPLEWQRLNREVFTDVHAGEEDPTSWVFWARSGWASINGGSAGLTPTMWGGDQNTDWGYDDGFPTIFPIGAHVGMSGVPIFGSDIAGYSWLGEGDLLSTKELFLRWSAAGAFHPLMRTHQGGAKCLNWSFDRDAETIAHYRRYASIHALLLPYFEARAAEAIEHGWPITRHPYLVFPEQPELWSGIDYMFFLGDDLLIAPVMEEGAVSRTVTLPGEGWWPLLGDSPLSAGGEQVIDATPTEIPVFVRPGTILPLLGEVVDSFYGATEEGVTDLGDVDGMFRVGLYPDSAGALNEVEFAGLRLAGAGWGELEQVDFSSARVGGVPVSECPEGELAQTCWRPGALVLVGDDVSVEVGSRTLELTSDAVVQVEVMLAGAAFGEHQAPTALEDLDSMAPPVCENRKE